MKQFQRIFLAAVIALITLLLYWQVVYYDYVKWDEGSYIVQNPHIRSFNLDNLYWMLTAVYAAMWSPVLWVSYAIDYQISGIDPFAYHLTNILLHTANSVWLFFLTLLFLKIQPIHAFSAKHQHLAALLAAVLFAIHPQHVESVAWIASRKDVLSLFFILATVWFYLHYNQNRSNLHYGFAIFSFALAIATKAVAMTVPLILVVLDVYLLQRINSYKSLWRYAVVEKLPFWGLALLGAGMAFYAHLVKGRIATIQDVSILERLLNAADMLLFYLGKFVFPLGLSPYYPFPETVSFYPVILLISLSGLLWILHIKYKHAAPWMVWLIFLIAIFPMLNIITFNKNIAGADRFVYFPMLGIYILIGIGLVKMCVACKVHWQLLSKVSVFFVFLGLIQITQFQLLTWKDKLHLWLTANQAYPKQFVIQTYLAEAYFEHRNYAAAIHYWQLNIEQNDDCVRCYDGLSEIYLRLGHLNAALFYLQKIVDYAKQQVEPMQGLDEVYFQMADLQGRLGDVPAALQAVEQGLLLNPHDSVGLQLKQQLAQANHKN